MAKSFLFRFGKAGLVSVRLRHAAQSTPRLSVLRPIAPMPHAIGRRQARVVARTCRGSFAAAGPPGPRRGRGSPSSRDENERGDFVAPLDRETRKRHVQGVVAREEL